MYQNILVPIDGSQNAQRALIHAIRLAAEVKTSRLTVFHVNHAVPINELSVQLGPDQLGREEGEAILGEAGTLLADAPFPYELKAVDGDPAQTICDAVRSGPYDLVVMGKRGRSLVEELLLGSVSHRVLQKASCPVLIVRS